ncbi:DNA/RNA non-specific endonuclease, partial [Armatimonas sp.]|uniref:DNA/RNA non-specific endonuclease n=1 Tax=Armatimonas sp. TaxID=1872638 RepID=UPI00286ADCC4
MMDIRRLALYGRERRGSRGVIWKAIICLGVGAALLTPLPVAHADTDPAAQMLLGNPDKAKSSPSSTEHFLLKRGQYALSYNDKLRFPNWVAWHLTAGDIGSTERGQFQPDPDLPGPFTHVVTRDYTSSGYDRGHNCPSKDRSASRKDNDIAFYMSNITPQAHGMNAGPWEQLESYCRQLAQDGNEIYITCGHGFTDQKYKTLGKAGIAVPDFGWKIILVLPEKGGNDLARINEQTRVIAVKMPNISTISKKDWREFRLSAGEIEQVTGLIFFDALPKKLADTLKSKVDFDQSAPSKRKKAA